MFVENLEMEIEQIGKEQMGHVPHLPKAEGTPQTQSDDGFLRSIVYHPQYLCIYVILIPE